MRAWLPRKILQTGALCHLTECMRALGAKACVYPFRISVIELPLLIWLIFCPKQLIPVIFLSATYNLMKKMALRKQIAQHLCLITKMNFDCLF